MGTNLLKCAAVQIYLVPKLWLCGAIQKFPNWVDNEINNNKHSLRSNTKGYGGETH
jgi:hypothetical protein